MFQTAKQSVLNQCSILLSLCIGRKQHFVIMFPCLISTITVSLICQQISAARASDQYLIIMPLSAFEAENLHISFQITANFFLTLEPYLVLIFYPCQENGKTFFVQMI